MKRILFAGVAVAAILAKAEVFNPAEFSSRMMVSFPGYSGSETLPGFPALVRLDAGLTSQMLTDGADLRFADANGISLPYEIDTWDSNGLSTAWVRIPELSHGVPIFAYWGNGNATAPADGTNVWAGYAGVWHLNEVDAALRNSTANAGIDGQRKGTVSAPGVVTLAQEFVYENNIRVPHNAALNLGDTFSVSGWFKYPDATPPNNWRRYFNKKNGHAADSGWEVEKRDNTHNEIAPRGNNGGNTYVAMPGGRSFADSPRGWFHVTVQYKGVNAGAVYVNGILAGDTNLGNSTATDSDEDFYIGGTRGGEGDQWRGFIDEVRLEPAIRSAAWLGACHDTMADPDFAVCGAPVSNTPFGAIVALGALDITHESARIQGLLNSPAPAFIVVQYSEDGGNIWASASAPAELGAAGFFIAPLEGLSADTPYLARIAVTDEFGGVIDVSAESVAFITASLPEPILGGISFDFAPGSDNANIDVAQLGINTRLVISWDAVGGGTWTHSATNPAVLGANTVALSGLQLGEMWHWRAELLSDSGYDSASGLFSVCYDYVWVGGNAGNRLWNDPANWEPYGVPNNPGSTATFNTDAYNSDYWGAFAVLETPITIGSATFNIPSSGVNRHYAVVGETLTFDNGAAPGFCQIIDAANFWRSMDFQCPVYFAGETHLSVTAPENGKWPFAISGDMDGPGPLVVTRGRLALMAGTGSAQVCRTPVETVRGANADTSSFVLKRGAGDSIFETPQTLYLGAVSGDQWGTFLSGGGRLIVSGAAVTNTHPFMYGSIFNWGGSTLLVSNKSDFVYTVYKDDRCLRFNGEHGTGNAIIINDSFVRLPTIGFNGAGNLIDVQDGGHLTFLYDRPHRTIVFNNYGNTMRVGSADPARPAVVDLNTMPMRVGVKVVDYQDFTMNDNLLLVTAGGIITNGALQVGYADFGDNGTYRGNAVEILDGGVFHSAGDCVIGVSTQGWRDDKTVDNTGNYVLLAAATATPSLWNLHNGNLTVGSQTPDTAENYATTNNALRIGYGGAVTNANHIRIGNANSTDNRLSLEGGALRCNNLTIAADNALAPVLSANGLLPARAGNTATLEPGAKIVASNPDNTVGRFPILNAPTINIAAPLDDPALLEAPDNYKWSLRLTNDPDNTQTLHLTCSTLNTLITIR